MYHIVIIWRVPPQLIDQYSLVRFLGVVIHHQMLKSVCWLNLLNHHQEITRADIQSQGIAGYLGMSWGPTGE